LVGLKYILNAYGLGAKGIIHEGHEEKVLVSFVDDIICSGSCAVMRSFEFPAVYGGLAVQI
jgi:hypothetical protein